MTSLRIFVATLLVVLVLAFAPPSQWVLRNTLDYWSGFYQYSLGIYPDEMLSNVSLNDAASPSIPTKFFFDELKSVREVPEVKNPEAHEEMWDRISKGIIERWGSDKVAMGIACRLICNGTLRDRVRTKFYDDKEWELARRIVRARAQANLEVALAAEKVDPENVLPTMVRAVALEAMDDHKGALRALADAAKKRTYTSYAFEEAEIIVSDREKAFGYRGEFERLVIYFSIMFPHVSSYRQMGQYLKDDAPARVDFAQVGLTMAGSDQTLVEHYIGMAMIRNAVANGPLKGKSVDDLRKDGDVAKFEAAAEKAGVKVEPGFWKKIRLASEKSTNPALTTPFNTERRWGLPIAAFGLGLWAIGAALALLGLRRDKPEATVSRLRQGWRIFVVWWASFFPAIILYTAMMRPGSGEFFYAWLIYYLLLWIPGAILLVRKPRAWMSGVSLIVGALSLVMGTGLEIRRDASHRNLIPNLRGETRRAVEGSGLGLLRGQNADNLDTGV